MFKATQETVKFILAIKFVSIELNLFKQHHNAHNLAVLYHETQMVYRGESLGVRVQ